MTLCLAPGLRLVQRDPQTLQLGLEPPAVAVLPDSPAVRRLVADLAAGHPPGRLGPEAARALSVVTAAGLVVDVADRVARARARAAARVHLDVPSTLAPALSQLVTAAGLVLAEDPGPVTMTLVAGDAAVARERLDEWSRHGVPHLVLTDRGAGWTVGPFVVPGRTACLRCIDAHRTVADPHHPQVLEQAATGPPLGPRPPDPALATVAIGWAVRDLVAAAEGDRPSTWSATVELDARLVPTATTWRRHPHCGCAWADAVESA